jgi:hypothetical protein
VGKSHTIVYPAYLCLHKEHMSRGGQPKLREQAAKVQRADTVTEEKMRYTEFKMEVQVEEMLRLLE